MKYLMTLTALCLACAALTGCHSIDPGYDCQVTLQVQSAPVILKLCNNPGDSSLLKALAGAAYGPDDFVSRFEKSNPGRNLASLFMKPGITAISLNSSNADVAAYLKKQVAVAARSASFTVTQRLKNIGPANPDVQLDEHTGIIKAAFKGRYSLDRLKAYLQAGGNLEFYETYTNAEILPLWMNINDTLAARQSATAAKEKPRAKKPAAAPSDTGSLPDEPGGSSEQDSLKMAAIKAQYPLFTIMQPYTDARRSEIIPGPIVGVIQIKDVDAFLRIVNDKEVKAMLPDNIRFCLGAPDVKSTGRPIYVYALKTHGAPLLDGSHVTKAFNDYDRFTKVPCVEMNMDATGAHIWQRMTARNIGNFIAIVVDSQVYSCPRVEGEISGGSTQISGSFTTEQAVDLANILKSGSLAAPVVMVGGSIGK